jgi:hypothetical protein
MSLRDLSDSLAYHGFDPDEYLRCYCLAPAGRGTKPHNPMAHCADHLGNHQAKGRNAPRYGTGTCPPGAYQEAVFNIFGDRAQRDLAERLYRDPDLLALRTDLVRLRKMQIEVEGEVREGECPEAWIATQQMAKAIVTRCERVRRVLGSDSDGLGEAIAEIADDANRITQYAQDARFKESGRKQIVGLISKAAKLSREERERLIQLRAFLPAEDVEAIAETVVRSVNAAADEVLTPENVRGMEADELRELVLATLANKLRLEETMERQRTIGA